MTTIGADPEVFLQDMVGNPVSSIGKIGGTKYNPLFIRDGIYLQEDNVTVEYNIPPCNTAAEFIKHNTTALEIIKEKAKALNLKINIAAAVKMPMKELKDPRSWVFGCEPDFNVWEMEYNPKPVVSNWRAAGGHIHIGFDGTNIQKVNITKYLDTTLGAILSFLDTDTQRKKMYGTAGSIRFKPYGLEYRTPSNYWLTHPFLMRLAFDLAAYSVQQIDGNIAAEKTKKQLLFINKRKEKELLNHITFLAKTIHLPESAIWLVKSIKNFVTISPEEKILIDKDKLTNTLNLLEHEAHLV